ncbi:MBOAT family O-acyltransferase [Flavobacterium soli]|uniref:MBOAT family O-acyltransferase n=1 Tax=Flavobacterium soli TaxID=344881 RepID=UPI00041B549F|nr:MBOAT family O-acyltransferase [Flavobacterium soli]
MLFNTVSFAIFLPVVLVLYWFVTSKNLKLQNLLLLLSSYFFYACWDYRFLFLLIFSTGLDYFTAIKIDDTSNVKLKKFWLWLSICINLGFLSVFKYYNFFIESFSEGLSSFGVENSLWTLNIILPVGISFYTFHGLSYIIDVYKERIKPEKYFIDYGVFVSFFPLLVAGPIERATHLLPQIKKKRFFSDVCFRDGLKQILWGLFKKVVIADNCARYVNVVFDNSDDYSGSTLVLVAILFAFQIYGDFSGYSDIALGSARLFGIDLLKNFAFPYFSRDIAEFWRRWHISLSSWFKDYVYIPLGGSRGTMLKQVKNIFIIFLLSGFWHGANWTFVFWGLINAIYFLPLLLLNRNRNNIEIVAAKSFFPSMKESLQMLFTFGLTTFAWIFFRSNSLQDAFSFISNIFTKSLFLKPEIHPKTTVMLIFVFIIIEWFGRRDEYAIAKMFQDQPRFIRWTFYYLIVFAIFYFSENERQFIYFQF